jgi:hypothetical protein
MPCPRAAASGFRVIEYLCCPMSWVATKQQPGSRREAIGLFRCQTVLLNQAEEMDMTGENRQETEDRLRRLRTELEERRSSIPIHSIRPHQLIEIEELEEEIEELKRKLDQS